VAHLCGITVWAYRLRDRTELPKGIEYGWDNDALGNSIFHCEGLLELGYTREPMDDFDLRDFITWAKEEIRCDATIETMNA
jgi:hypothetical protein